MSSPDLGQAERHAVLGVMQTPFLSIGPQVDLPQGELARCLGGACVTGVCNGTAGFHHMLLAAGVGPRDEVITTFSFVASANAVVYAKAKPVVEP